MLYVAYVDMFHLIGMHLFLSKQTLKRMSLSLFVNNSLQQLAVGC